MSTAVASPSRERFHQVTTGPREDRPAAKPERLVSLDAFRGFIMVMLASHAFGLATLEGDATWGWLGRQFEHVTWEGLRFWDLIQPAFVFMVGVAMPFAFATRRSKEGQGAVWRHVAYRAVMLIVISNLIMSISRGELFFQLINVLAQIGFTYFLCYWLMQLPFRAQAVSAGLILAGHWAMFLLLPGADGPYQPDTNAAERFDAWIGLSNPGHWANLNFITSTVTTLFGVWAGTLMFAEHTHKHRMRVLAMWAAGCFAAGYAISFANPVIKRICTSSFTLVSAGWVLLMLLGFYWLVEVRGFKRLTWPLVVVGMNSIFIYCLGILLGGWLNRAVGVFTGEFEGLGLLGPIAQRTAVFAVMWYLCYWLYKRRIWIKV